MTNAYFTHTVIESNLITHCCNPLSPKEFTSYKSFSRCEFVAETTRTNQGAPDQMASQEGNP